MPLEQALSSLAPRVYIDYEIRQGAPPAPLGIFLLGLVDPEPALNAVVRANSQGVLITGNTEDTGKPPADDPLRVLYEKEPAHDRLEAAAAGVVVMAVADVLGVPAEIKYDGAEIVDANIEDTLLPEEAIRGLSPNVRLYVRVDRDPREAERCCELAVVPAGGEVTTVDATNDLPGRRPVAAGRGAGRLGGARASTRCLPAGTWPRTATRTKSRRRRPWSCGAPSRPLRYRPGCRHSRLPETARATPTVERPTSTSKARSSRSASRDSPPVEVWTNGPLDA